MKTKLDHLIDMEEKENWYEYYLKHDRMIILVLFPNLH